MPNRLIAPALVACAALLAASPPAWAVAYFWLSTSDTSPPGPEVAVSALTVGSSDKLYIWARPEAGKKLRNFSLNVIADATGLDLVDGSFSIENSLSGAAKRFEHYIDSATIPSVASEYGPSEVGFGMTDELYDLKGFTVTPNATIRGIGPVCLEIDPNCHTATDGMPAWLVGELGVTAISTGTVNLNLQIGDAGMNHEVLADGDYNFDSVNDSHDFTQWLADYGSTTYLNSDGNGDNIVDSIDYAIWRENLGAAGTVEPAAMTDVIFGVDKSDGFAEPAHNAATDRSVNLSFDDPDAVITITAPAPSPVAPAPEPTSVAALLLGVAGAMLGRPAKGPIKK